MHEQDGITSLRLSRVAPKCRVPNVTDLVGGAATSGHRSSQGLSRHPIIHPTTLALTRWPPAAILAPWAPYNKVWGAHRSPLEQPEAGQTTRAGNRFVSGGPPLPCDWVCPPGPVFPNYSILFGLGFSRRRNIPG
jgi:hypothetical protein